MTGIQVCNVCCAPNCLPVFCRRQTCRIDADCWQPHHPNTYCRGPRCRYLSYRTAVALSAYRHQDEVRRYSKANCPRACTIGIFHWVRFLRIGKDRVKSYDLSKKPSKFCFDRFQKYLFYLFVQRIHEFTRYQSYNKEF